MNEKKSKNLVAFVPRIADTTHMDTSEKNFVRGFAIVCAIMATMIVGVYWIEQNTKSQSCECKCFDAGYLQACEDFQNLLDK